MYACDCIHLYTYVHVLCMQTAVKNIKSAFNFAECNLVPASLVVGFPEAFGLSSRLYDMLPIGSYSVLVGCLVWLCCQAEDAVSETGTCDYYIVLKYVRICHSYFSYWYGLSRNTLLPLSTYVFTGPSYRFFALPSRNNGRVVHFIEVTLYAFSSVGQNVISLYCNFDAVEPLLPSHSSTVLPLEAIMRKVWYHTTMQFNL